MAGGNNQLSSNGPITAVGGVLDLGTFSQTTSAAVTFQGGTVQNGTINETGTAYNGQSGTVAANLAGAVGLTKTAAGTLTLGGSNTYGNTTINAGNLVFTSTAATPAGSQNITINNGGGLDIAGAYPTAASWLTSNLINPASSGALALTVSSSENINFSGFNSLSLGAVGTQTYTGTITPANNTYFLGGGGGMLVLPGSPALTNSGTTPQSLVVSGGVTLAGSNTFTGLTTVSNAPSGYTLLLASSSGPAITGNVQIGNSVAGGAATVYLAIGAAQNQFGPGTVVSFAANNSYPVLKLMGYNQTVAGISDPAGVGYIENTQGETGIGSSVLTVNNTANCTYAGYIRSTNNGSGTLGLTKTGSGVLTLAGGNMTYTGSTTVSGGTLTLQNNDLVALPSIAVNAGAVLQYSDSGGITQPTTTLLGSGTLQKIGAGTLTFGGAGNITWNLGAGAVIDVEAGTLVGGSNIQDFWTTNLASLNIASGATFNGVEANLRIDALTGSGTFKGGWTGAGYSNETIGVNNGSGAFSGSIQDNAAPLVLVKTGSGTQVLSGANTYTGGTTLQGGILSFANASLGTTGSISFSGNATLQWFGSNTQDVSSRIVMANGVAATFDTNGNNVVLGSSIGGNGSASLVKAGSGMLALGGNNTYSGGTTINGGTLQVGNGGAAGSLGSGAVTDNATLAFARSDSACIVNNAISGSGGLVQVGPGMTTLAATNTVSGVTSLSGGTLALASPLALQQSTLDIGAGVLSFGNLTSGTLGGLQDSGNLALTNANNASVALAVGNNGAGTTYSGGLSGLGNLTKIGSGALALTGNSTMGGSTNVNQGILQVNGSLRVPNLYVNNAAQLAGAGTINVSGGDGFVYGSSVASTFAGTLAGTKLEVDSGSLTLSGSSTYAGGTTMNNGTLVLANTAGSATGAGPVVVNGGVLTGTGTAGGSVSILGGTLAPGGATIGTMGITGSLNLAGSSSFRIDTTSGAGGVNDAVTGIGNINYGGTLNIQNVALSPSYSSGESWDLFSFSGGTSGAFTNVFDHNVVAGLPSLPSSLKWEFNYGLGDLYIANAAVFSGSATWTSTSGSLWSDQTHWTDGNGLQGVPGLAGSNGHDSAAFASSGSVTSIDLTGVNPNLAALSFSTSNYTLSGGSLTLQSNSGAATVTVASGTQSIGSALFLAGSVDIAPAGGSELSISGNIHELSAGQSLTLSDNGTLILSGSNDYSGGTVVEAGTLIAASNTALLDGSVLTVGAGGTFIFDPTAAAAPSASPQVRPAGVEAVPEPGTLVLLLAALWSAAIYRRFHFRPKVLRF